MKRLVTILLLFFSIAATAQQWRPQPYFYQYRGIMADSLLRLGANDTTMYPAGANEGAMIFRRQVGDTAYYYSNGKRWKKIGNDVDLSAYMKFTDTTALSNRINQKLNAADTSGMLSKYLRKTDTVTLSNRINGKLSTTDTSGMLVSYLRRADTATLSNRINLKEDVSNKSTATGLGGSNILYPTQLAVKTYVDNAVSTGVGAYIPLAQKAANNGVASLDAGGKVPFTQLPASLMIYKGTWVPSTNTPTIADGTGTAGWVYKANADGSANLGSGSISFLAGDFVIHNGTRWERSVGTDNVVSVNGQQGVVSLTTTNISEGSNLYWTNARGDVRYPLLSGAYNNPSWITGLAWTKITGTPSTLAGYGIIDAAPTSGSGNYIQSQFVLAQNANMWISGSIQASSNVAVKRDGSNTVISSFHLLNNAGNRGVIMQLNGDVNPGLSTWVHNGTSYTEMMRINSSGNVGIGNASPAEKLDVTGSIIASANITAATFLSRGVNPLLKFIDGTNSDVVLQMTAGRLDFNNPNAVTSFTGSASVGIGTGSPSEKLHVSGNILANKFMLNSVSAAVAGAGLFAPANGIFGVYTNSAERMRIDGSGNVGIGRTSSGNKLEVAGAITATGSLGAAVRSSLNLEVSGDIGAMTFVRADGGLGQIVFNKDTIIYQAGMVRSPGRFVQGGTIDDGDAAFQTNGTIRAGGVVMGIKVITSNYTITNNDYTIINRATSGNPVLTLGSAVANPGRVYVISDEAGTGNLMSFSPAIRLKGANYTNLNDPVFPTQSVVIQSDGTNWVPIKR
jgi:hypothetical protein